MATIATRTRGRYRYDKREIQYISLVNSIQHGHVYIEGSGIVTVSVKIWRLFLGIYTPPHFSLLFLPNLEG